MHLTKVTSIGFVILFLFSAAWAEDAVDIPPLEDRVRETQLDNGLKVVVVEREIAPVFFALMNFSVGSTIENFGSTGLSHFMEHMLFKGSKKIGTKDYAAEQPIMEELESVAAEMKEIRISLKNWRFDIFEDYMNEVKSNVQAGAEAGSAAKWQAVLEALPADSTHLPDEWKDTPWIYYDGARNFWADYRKIIERRLRMSELLEQQREYIIQTHIDAIYDQHGAKMVNAYTSYDETGYMVGLPSNCLELWMHLESDRFMNPVFREYYAEREVVQEELLMHENNPRSFLFKNLMTTAFNAHPYGRPIIGWRRDIQLTLRSEMDDHFHRFYGPNNCQITIVGNVNADEAFAMVEDYFGEWEPVEIAHEVTTVEPAQKGEKRIAVEFDAQPMFLIGYHVPAAPHPDYYALSMMQRVLSGGRTSRLYRSIFEKQMLTAGPPYAFVGPGDRYPGLFIFGGAPNAMHTVEEVENAIYQEVETLQTELVSDKEIERIRNQYKTYQLARLKSNQWLAFSLASGFVNRGDWRSIIEDYERLVQVNAEDIKRVANEYFNVRNRTVAYLVKPEAKTAETEQAEGGLEQ